MGDDGDVGGIAGLRCALRVAAGVGLPAAVAPRLSARRLVGGHRARRGDSRGVSGGRTARAGRDRRLCGGAQPAGVDSMLVAETAGMTFRQRRASGTAYGRSMAVSSEIRRTSMSGSQSENGRNLLAVNPNDNQGYRFPLMDSLVQSTEWKKVLSHAAKHDDGGVWMRARARRARTGRRSPEFPRGRDSRRDPHRGRRERAGPICSSTSKRTGSGETQITSRTGRRTGRPGRDPKRNARASCSRTMSNAGSSDT